MAVLGEKLQPTSHGCPLYQALAFSAVHRDAAEAGMTHTNRALNKHGKALDVARFIVRFIRESSL
jgi:hypothetical protein